MLLFAYESSAMPAVPSYLIECENCGHCSDLSGCPQAPSNIEGRSIIETFTETMLDMIAQGTFEFANYNSCFHCDIKVSFSPLDCIIRK